MIKIISRLAVLAGFLLAFSCCHLIRKSKVASAESSKPAKRTVAGLGRYATKIIFKARASKSLQGEI